MPTLNFKGKTFVQNHHLAVKYHQLVPQKALSFTDKVSLHDNLIVQGDNLKALKALLPTYAGKVKCIYIDPPYNTGNEGWTYDDNVNSPMLQEWLGKVVDKEDLTRHDKWLCMMMPRLKLLRDLLSEDGAIFISIDDNEQHRLRMLCDEIFGDDNFITNIAWEKRYTRSNDAKLFSNIKEHMLLYRKTEQVDRLRERRNEKSNSIYSNPDDDPRGPWTSVSYVSPRTKEERPNLSYPIQNPFTNKEIEHPTNSWKYVRETYEKQVEENRLYWGQEGNFKFPRLKRFLNEMNDELVPVDLWRFDEVGTTDQASNSLKEIFGELVFATPKPVSLIKKCFSLITDKNSIILDSFAGSATTAQAVLELNKEDGGNRKFILVEQEDYANTITAERVRRIIKGVKGAKSENLKEGLGGTFSYFTLGDAIEMESLLKGENLPSYKEFARYLFYTASGEEFDEKAINEKINFIGESRNYEVYLFYKAEMDWLRANALDTGTLPIVAKTGWQEKAGVCSG